jgi:ubiquinone/menaquinone biosynthesis C-methylase UbiE
MQMPEVMQFGAEVSQQLEAAYLTPDIVEQRRLHGIDPSEQMLAIAARRSEPVAGSAPVRFQAGDCW